MTKHPSLEAARATLAPITVDSYFDHAVTPDEPLLGPWSKSALSRLAEDPAEWLAGVPFKETAKMRFGSLVDDYLFWPQKFRSETVVTSDCPWNKNPGKAEYIAAKKAGKTPLKPDEMAKILTIEKNLMDGPKDGYRMLQAEHQVPILGVVELNYRHNGKDGVLYLPMKGLTDGQEFLTGESDVWDMKITSARNIADIWSIFTGLKYHWQDILYTELLEANGISVGTFRFVFVQDDAPHRVQVVECDENLRSNAKVGLTKAFQQIALLAEGYTPNDFYPEVAKFGVENPWRRFAELTAEDQKRFEKFEVKFHGAA